jgi:hypothetical protein
MSGFDWATYKDNTASVRADLTLNAFDEFPLPPPLSALDQYGFVEGLSGTRFGDRLDGSESTAVEIAEGGNNPNGSALLASHIGLITGLNALLGNGVKRGDGGFDAGDIILGGDGSDVITGRGGNDVIDGDKWLNVRIAVHANADGTGAVLGYHTSMRTLTAQIFSGAINPGQLKIARSIDEILDEDNDDIDVAVFRGNRAEYTIDRSNPGFVRVSHVAPVGAFDDGVDTLYAMERLRFADMEVFAFNSVPIGAPAISDTSPTEGQQLTATPGNISDPNGTSNAAFTYQWQTLIGATWMTVANGPTFTPGQAQVNAPLRVVASYTDDGGTAESVASAPTDVVGDLYNGTGGNNTFNGTAGANIANGAGGNDTLNGNGGEDTLTAAPTTTRSMAATETTSSTATAAPTF